MAQVPIPVTIITGFLGAGKTTFLNRLIQDNTTTRFAIIENEFGEIGIDNELVIGSDEQIFEMSNGCICCRLNGELIQFLDQFVEKVDLIDHLIIETTGIAEPDSVAAAFVSNPNIQQTFRIDSVVCLVDGQHTVQHLTEREEAKRQITFSDLLLISKVDQIHDSELESLKIALRSINPFASIALSSNGHTDVEILQLSAYHSHQVERSLHHIKEGKVHAHDDISSVSLILEGAIDFLKFKHWMNVLLMIQGNHIYRVKGIMHFDQHDHKTIVQSVRASCLYQKGDQWGNEKDRVSRIVFIGKFLNEAIFRKQLNYCVVK